MSVYSIDVFMPVLILIALTVGVVLGGHFLSVFLAPKKSSKFQTTPYECGELPVGMAWSMFNVRFYVVGLIFIIFDVESVLMFPVVSVFKSFNDMGRGGLALIEVLIFMLILISGMAYCWRKGDLDWVKSYKRKQVE
ncbi:MAG: NADH-quinone oxidoreductase subunit A [Bacteriovoracales bacterium]|nr:NADH-quinone oxidoreductase subunit A [Bacteriovoracales bacterium]